MSLFPAFFSSPRHTAIGSEPGQLRIPSHCPPSTSTSGRVAPLAFYCGEAQGLWLGEEWHMNRLDMVSTRACSDPNRDHPMWDDRRIIDTAFGLLREGALSVDGLVTPIVPMDEAAEAYREIDEHPERSIKMGVRF